MTYVSPLGPSPKKSPLPVLFGVLGIVILGGLVVVAYLVSKGAATVTTTTPTVSQIFTTAILQGLTTGKVQRRVVYQGMDYTLQVDASTPSAVHYSGTVERTNTKGRASADVYGSIENSFIQYKTGSSSALVSPALVGSWLWVRQKGWTPPALAPLLGQMTSPEYLLLGAYVFGNFSAQQRSAIEAFLTSHQVFVFDPTKVVKSTLNGKDVLVYQVDFNADNLVAYNRLLATDFGMDEKNMTTLLASLPYYSGNKVYIDPNLKQVVQVEFTIPSSGLAITQTFDKFGSASPADQPTEARVINQLTPMPTL
jgi:hypothetical protein